MPACPPTIAATLIVRNEARCITRCLESVRPWVDHMVVLDTGSTDDTVALAQRCGAQVHHLDWPDDFSAARNHGLALSDADWNLVIDADEWIASGGETLRTWCDGPARLGALCIRSSFDLSDTAAVPSTLPATRSWIARLLPRGVRYEGRIHEQPVSYLPVERIDLHLDHDGYMAAQADAKRDRNRPMLLAELRDDPGNAYILYQLGKEAEARKAYTQASRYYDRAFARAPDDAAWRHSLLIRHLHCLGQSGGVEEAIAIAEQQLEKWQDSPDFFFVLGNLLMDRAMSDPANALDEWLPLAATMWERCLAIGERPELEGSVEGRGSYLAQHNLDVMRQQLMLLGA